MALTAYRPYTGARTLLGARSSIPPPPAYRSPPGDQGNPRDPAFPWYKPSTPSFGEPPPPDTRPPTNGSGGGDTTSGSTDPYANDPIYQQLIAMANANVAQAQAAATAERKQLAIGLGDPGLAMKLGLGQQIADTAQANPFSTLKNLLRGHNSNVTGIDTGTNKANLFYSSTRVRDQQREQTGYQGNIAGAEGAAQRQLAAIAAALLAAEQAAAYARANAAGDAYGRAKGTPHVPPGVNPDTYAGQLLSLAQYQNIGSARTPEDTYALSPATILRLLSGKGGGL